MNQTQSISDYIESNLPIYLDILRQMVSINSFTSNQAGVNKLGLQTAELFGNMGFKSEFMQASNPGYGKHVVLTSKGFNNQRPTIALISHLDTVFPPEEEIANDFIWRREGDRIHGPGTVDIKGGTVMIYMVLDTLQTYFSDDYQRSNWMILLNASEETLTPDFGELCLARLPDNTLACLVFEGGAVSGQEMSCVISRKGRAIFQVQVEGKAAHAGNNHSQGANAIEQLAHTVQTIATFTDYTTHITFNVGTITGGTVVNRVPHYAEANIEMRAFDPYVFNTGVEQILALNGTSQVSSVDGFACKVQVNLLEETAPWPHNENTRQLFQIWENVAASLGFQLTAEERGGLSDGNWLWDHFPTIDGLGPNGAFGHCSERSPDGSKEQEYVLVSSFTPKALLNTLAIANLLENRF